MYPSSDGLPLAENDWQLTAIHDAFGVLVARTASAPAEEKATRRVAEARIAELEARLRES